MDEIEKNKNRDPYIRGFRLTSGGDDCWDSSTYVRRANRDGIRLLQNMRGSWVIVWNMKWYL